MQCDFMLGKAQHKILTAGFKRQLLRALLAWRTRNKQGFYSGAISSADGRWESNPRNPFVCKFVNALPKGKWCFVKPKSCQLYLACNICQWDGALKALMFECIYSLAISASTVLKICKIPTWKEAQCHPVPGPWGTWTNTWDIPR